MFNVRILCSAARSRLESTTRFHRFENTGPVSQLLLLSTTCRRATFLHMRRGPSWPVQVKKVMAENQAENRLLSFCLLSGLRTRSLAYRDVIVVQVVDALR